MRFIHVAMAAMAKRIAPVMAVAAVLGVPSRILAQDPVAPVRDTIRGDSAAARLEPVEVRGSIVPSAGPKVGSGVPARITTLSGTELRESGARTVADALGSVTGLSIYDDLGSAYKLNLSTRGFTAGPTIGLPPGVTVFLDGVRQNEPDAQEVNFDLLPMDAVERVDLLSGSASLLGPNSLGGAINLITRRGKGRPWGQIEISGGSFASLAAAASAGGLVGRGADYYLNADYGWERGWRDATGARNYSVFSNLGHTRESRGITMQLYAARSRAETAGSLPESIYHVDPRVNFTAGDFDDLNMQQVAVSGYSTAGGGRMSANIYLRHSGGTRFNVNQAPDANVRSLTKNSTLGSSADWRRAATIGSGSLAFRAGFEATADRVHARIFAESAGNDSLTTDVRSPSTDLASFGILDYAIGRATFSGAARYDVVRVPFRDLLNSERTSNVFRSLNPRLGLAIALSQNASVYASAGRSFRAPAILELACADPDAACPLPFALGDDPPLKPVRATTLEAGGQWIFGALLLKGSVYRTGVRDEILFIASDVARLSGFFTNIPRTQREGAELSAQLNFAARASAYANYSASHATFLSATEIFSLRSDPDFASSPLAGSNEVEAGDDLPMIPRQQIKAGVTLRPRDGIELGADARRIGRQWLRGDEANETSPLEPYTLVSARAGFDRGGWSISSVVTNVFDTHRASFGTFNENRVTGLLERFLTPADARTVRLTVSRRLGAGHE